MILSFEAARDTTASLGAEISANLSLEKSLRQVQDSSQSSQMPGLGTWAEPFEANFLLRFGTARGFTRTTIGVDGECE